MAQKTRAQLLADINTILTTNANNEITGALLNALMIDINDSAFNLSTDLALLAGLNEFDTGTSYSLGACAVFENKIYQATEAISPGAFDVSKWFLLTSTNDPASDFGFVPYDNGATYNVDDRVEYQNKLFKCDQNGTTGVIPDDISANWTEVSASGGQFGEAYSAGTYYLTGDVVSFTDNKLYEMTAAGSPFYSTDFATELGAGDWTLFHDVAGTTTLSDALSVGNTTGGNDIQVTAADIVEFLSSANDQEMIKFGTSNYRVFHNPFGENGILISKTTGLTHSWICITDSSMYTGFGQVGGGLGNSNSINHAAGGSTIFSADKPVAVFPATNNFDTGNSDLPIVFLATRNPTSTAATSFFNCLLAGGRNLIPITNFLVTEFLEVQGDTARYRTEPTLTDDRQFVHKGYVNGVKKWIADAVTGSLVLGAITTIPSATHTIADGGGDYIIEFIGDTTFAVNSTGSMGVYKNGVLITGSLRNFGGDADDPSVISTKCVKTAGVDTDVFDVRATLGAGAVTINANGFFSIEKVI